MDIKKHIGEKIKEFRSKRGMSQDQLAILLETTKQTVSRYEKGDRQANQDVLFKLANIFNVSIDEFFPKINDNNIRKAKKIETSEYPYLPVDVAAGLPETVDPIMEEDIEIAEIPDVLMGKWAGRDDIFIMRVNGESMNKIIPNDSLIAVQKIDINNLQNGDIVVYSNHYEYSVKKFYKLEDQFVFRPHSTDINFTEYRVPFDSCHDLRMHGKVVLYIVNLD